MAEQLEEKYLMPEVMAMPKEPMNRSFIRF